MSPIVDLRSQLLDRINRLQGLINFIARNGLLGKVCLPSFILWFLTSSADALVGIAALASESEEALVARREAQRVCRPVDVPELKDQVRARRGVALRLVSGR